MRDTKHLEKHSNKIAESKKEKALFRTQRKAVEAGAHGTLDYLSLIQICRSRRTVMCSSRLSPYE